LLNSNDEIVVKVSVQVVYSVIVGPWTVVVTLNVSVTVMYSVLVVAWLKVTVPGWQTLLEGYPYVGFSGSG